MCELQQSFHGSHFVQIFLLSSLTRNTHERTYPLSVLKHISSCFLYSSMTEQVAAQNLSMKDVHTNLNMCPPIANCLMQCILNNTHLKPQNPAQLFNYKPTWFISTVYNISIISFQWGIKHMCITTREQGVHMCTHQGSK